MEEFQAKLLRSKDEELSQMLSSEMARKEQEMYEIEQRAKKQAEEYSLDRIRLEEEHNKRMAELKAKQEQAQAALVGKYLVGEEAAMRNNTFKIFELKPGRLSEFNDIGEIHFRYAESQFLRLRGSTNYRVTQVDYVVNPPLIVAFEAKQQELMSSGRPYKPILAFHGTSKDSVDNIIRNNFDMRRISSNTGDYGYFGKGFYFSEFVCTSMGYNQNQSSLLLSKVLIGRQYKCPDMMEGAPLMPGYDSHLSPDGTEVVIFDNTQILPCYIVHYHNQNPNHRY
eukprot:TRINITY_DN2097_c0_g11_i1.p1 TRINITY_DN2097_c0_g11~~TRINITY_DN2097_c0_g11_i1.p1  ORF type:complete len:311 (+),score=66.63 TRINITY_DN2097_c0_g11_i1:89-934(+)